MIDLLWWACFWVVFAVCLFMFAYGLTEEANERDRITFDLIDRMKEVSEEGEQK